MKTFWAVGRAAVTTGTSSCDPPSPAAIPTATASAGMTASFQATAAHRPLRRLTPPTGSSGSLFRRGLGAPARLMPSASIMSGTATRPSISRPWAG